MFTEYRVNFLTTAPLRRLFTGLCQHFYLSNEQDWCGSDIQRSDTSDSASNSAGINCTTVELVWVLQVRPKYALTFGA